MKEERKGAAVLGYHGKHLMVIWREEGYTLHPVLSIRHRAMRAIHRALTCTDEVDAIHAAAAAVAHIEDLPLIGDALSLMYGTHADVISAALAARCKQLA